MLAMGSVSCMAILVYWKLWYMHLLRPVQISGSIEGRISAKTPISVFFGFQWQILAEILRLFKKYDILRKVAE